MHVSWRSHVQSLFTLCSYRSQSAVSDVHLLTVCCSLLPRQLQASTMMLKHKVNSLPVVENGKVVGVLTRHDVLRALIASHSPLL